MCTKHIASRESIIQAQWSINDIFFITAICWGSIRYAWSQRLFVIQKGKKMLDIRHTIVIYPHYQQEQQSPCNQ